MTAVWKLVRPLNLAIIAATMYALRLFLVVYEQRYDIELLRKDGEGLDFFLLVFSTVLIAAAGNAINDYFDIKADRINRPERVIVGRILPRRKAIMVHWVCNSIAFLIAIMLSVRNHTFWYVFIHLISINTLWLYSLYLKRKAIIGNFTIALLTALVPILCGVHFFVQHSLVWERGASSSAFDYWLQLLVTDGIFIIFLAFFAFANNFAREIIKDIEDVPGDKELNADTLPIKYGQRVSKIWIGSFLVLPIFFFFSLFYFIEVRTTFGFVQHFTVFIPVVLSLLADFISIILVWRAQTKEAFKLADRFVKLAMIFGILTPVYWLLWI